MGGVFRSIPLQAVPLWPWGTPGSMGRREHPLNPPSWALIRFAHFPFRRDESELVLVLNGHILELTQSLLEQVLTGPSEIAAGRGTEVR